VPLLTYRDGTCGLLHVFIIESKEKNMNERSLEVMAANMPWALRERIDATLASKLISEKQEFERRLARVASGHKVRRRYPQVHPKYVNPDNPSQIWSGRGLKPRWFRLRLEAGRSVNNLLIGEPGMAA
jgi:DNA-binding protein H-NS